MPNDRITIVADEPGPRIAPELYGHFAEHLGACVDGGVWVGESSLIPNDGGIRTDVVAALKKISPPVIRWPGGCFADDYHWEDGVGPRDARPRTVNVWWGHTLEDNAFGTHEFLRFCKMIGSKPYLAGNVGSGSPREMKGWVEYCNFAGDSTLARRRAANGQPEPFGVYYWGVGNEAWGCGGCMCPEDYAGEYKRFATYVSTFARRPLNMPLFLVACGPSGNDPDWTRRFFTKAGVPRGDWALHGFAAHYYCGTAGTATEFSVDQWYELLHRAAGVEDLILQQRAILDGFDPQRRIGLVLDEWGTWHPPAADRNRQHLWQQNTQRDALVAALTLDAFNRNADKLVMANIAQVINVLQALILTDGPRMLLTPTYHVFDLYKAHQDGTLLRSIFAGGDVSFATGAGKQKMPRLSGSASMKEGVLTLSVTNADAMLPVDAEIDVRGAELGEARVATLCGEELSAHNTFEEPNIVNPTRETIDAGRGWRHMFPPASVTVVTARVGRR